MTTRRNSKPLRLVAAGATLLSILACGGGGPESESDQARSAVMRQLESHLDEGTTYGEGPDGQYIADAIRHTLAPEDGVVVRVIPGTPRNIVALVRYRSGGGFEDLRDIPSDERNAEIDRIMEAVDRRYGAQTENMALGIRGGLFYGALMVRMAGQPMQYHSGSVVSLSHLDPLLNAAPGADATLEPLPLSEQIQGTILGPPSWPVARSITVTEPTPVVAQLVANTMEASEPFLVLCNGGVHPMRCLWDETLEVPRREGAFDERLDAMAEDMLARGRTFTYEAYDLSPGTYTAVIAPDCNDTNCPSAGTSFALIAGRGAR